MSERVALGPAQSEVVGPWFGADLPDSRSREIRPPTASLGPTRCGLGRGEWPRRSHG